MNRDDVVSQLEIQSRCAIGNELAEVGDTGVLWPDDDSEPVRWFICLDHLPELQARYERIKFKESTAKMLEEFKKK